jgi:hypothetical protein
MLHLKRNMPELNLMEIVAKFDYKSDSHAITFCPPDPDDIILPGHLPVRSGKKSAAGRIHHNALRILSAEIERDYSVS